jgi:hypothetical protein
MLTTIHAAHIIKEPLGIIVLYSRDIMVSWKRFPDVNVLPVEKRMKTKMA